MIYVYYNGRLGNNIFQYVVASYLSFKCQQPIANHLENNILENHFDLEHTECQCHSVITLHDRNILTYLQQIDSIKKKNIHLRGYFQNCHLIDQISEFIHEYFSIRDDPIDFDLNRSIIMHLRLDDFNHEGYNSEIIHYQWYLSILESEQFDQLYIIYDAKGVDYYKPRCPKISFYDQKYVVKFQKYNPIICSSCSILSDYNLIKKSEKIICSNSTFCFWPVFFSTSIAKTIYCPVKKNDTNSIYLSIKNAKHLDFETLDITQL